MEKLPSPSSIGISAAGTGDSYLLTRGQTLTPLQKGNLLAQTAAMGGSIVANTGPTGALIGVSTGWAAFNAASAVFATDISSYLSDSNNPLTSQTQIDHDLLTLGGDVLTIGGDLTIIAGAYTNYVPLVGKFSAAELEGMGDVATLGGMVLGNTDLIVPTINDFSAQAQWAITTGNYQAFLSNDTNDLIQGTSTAVSGAWNSTISNLSNFMGAAANFLGSANTSAAPADATAVENALNSSKVAFTNLYNAVDVAPENISATLSGTTAVVSGGGTTVNTESLLYSPSGTLAGVETALPDGTDAISADGQLLKYQAPDLTNLSFAANGDLEGTIVPTQNNSTPETLDVSNNGITLSENKDGYQATLTNTGNLTVNPDGTTTQMIDMPNGGSVILTTDPNSFTQSFEAHTGPDGTGGMTMYGQTYGDGSSSYSLFDPNTGSQVYSASYDKNDNLIGETHMTDAGASDATNYNVYIDTVASALAGQYIRTLFPNNVPAAMAAEAFASTSLQTILGTAGSYTVNGVTYTGSDAFSANFGYAFATMGGGIAGSDLGALLDKALGISVPVGSITLGAAGTAGIQYVAALTAKDILGVSSGFGVETVGGATKVTVDFTTAFEDGLAGAFGAFAGGQLASLVVPPSVNSQIGGAVASTVGTAVALALDPELAPLEVFSVALGSNFLGDLIGDVFGTGYRGRATANGTMNFDNGALTAGQVFVDNGGDASIASQMVTAVLGTVNPVLKTFGGTVSSLNSWNVGQYESNYFSDNGTWPPPASTQYGDPNDAISNASLNILRSATLSGANPYMVFMLQKSDATTLQGLIDDLNAAHDYSLYVSNPLGFDVSIALTGSATTLQTWQSELARIQALGLDKFTPVGSSQLAIADTSANLQAELPALEALAKDGGLASLTSTDNGIFSLTATELTNDAAALNKILGIHEMVFADPNTTETIAGTLGGIDTLNFSNITQKLAVNVSAGSATTTPATPITPPLIAGLQIQVSPLNPNPNTYSFSNFKDFVATPTAGGTTFAGAASALTGVSLQDLLPGDGIDINDLLPGSASLKSNGSAWQFWDNAAHSATMNVLNSPGVTGFSIASDQHGGTLFTATNG